MHRLWNKRRLNVSFPYRLRGHFIVHTKLCEILHEQRILWKQTFCWFLVFLRITPCVKNTGFFTCTNINTVINGKTTFDASANSSRRAQLIYCKHKISFVETTSFHVSLHRQRSCLIRGKICSTTLSGTKITPSRDVTHIASCRYVLEYIMSSFDDCSRKISRS